MAIVTGKAAFIELANSLLVYGNDVINEANCSVGLPSVFDPEEIDPDEIGEYSLVNTSVEVTALEGSPFSGFRKIYYTRLDLNKIEPLSIEVNFNGKPTDFVPTDAEFMTAFAEATLLPIDLSEVDLNFAVAPDQRAESVIITSKATSYTSISSVQVKLIYDQQKDIRTAVYDGRMINGY